MNRSKIYFLAFALVSQLLFATSVFAKTSMWKISKGDDVDDGRTLEGELSPETILA